MKSQGSTDRTVAFQIMPGDNVATLLSDAATGDRIAVRGERHVPEIISREPIGEGHKVALVPIDRGAKVIKYGTSIGSATRAIDAGEWVHLHNCRSNYDARSSTFDVSTGNSTDVRYE